MRFLTSSPCPHRSRSRLPKGNACRRADRRRIPPATVLRPRAKDQEMPAPTTSPAQAPVNSRSRVLVASLIGTTIEFYDFYIYATAAVLVFPALFFPSSDPTTALLSSFAVFGAAMVARPIGAVVFRTPRRPDRPQGHAGGLASHHGHRHLPHRRAAHLRAGRLDRHRAAGADAARAGFRTRRRVERPRPGRHRERPQRQARPLRHVPPAGSPARLHHRQRALPDHRRAAAVHGGCRPVAALRGLPELGLARAGSCSPP